MIWGQTLKYVINLSALINRPFWLESKCFSISWAHYIEHQLLYCNVMNKAQRTDDAYGIVSIPSDQRK